VQIALPSRLNEDDRVPGVPAQKRAHAKAA
jgi:hypothetical protein